MLPSETMIWQPEFTDKTLSRKPGAVHNRVTFYRDGYQSPCVQPLARFMKEFAEVNKC
ncbi:DUF4222 domain-containing protein [Escherichia coli]|nr:DUF4222 domain-containing protein [Escherichia coli]